MTGKPRAANRNPDFKIRRLVFALLDWYSRHARDLPWRRTRDPYAVWISEIMLQQTQAATVIPYWKRWMRALPRMESLARAPMGQLHKLWEGLGYYRRVDHLQRAARLIVKEHEGHFPRAFEAVLELPGIGRYTAGAIWSIAFDQPTPILDGNVIRVLTRIFGIDGNPREKKINCQLWVLAEQLVRAAAILPNGSASCCSRLNQSLMELGALVCTPRQPTCGRCPARQLCVAFRQNRNLELPALPRRPAPSVRRFAAFVAHRDGRYLVRRRPSGVVNARLWEFPNAELTHARSSLRAAAGRALPFRANRLVPLCTVKHSITRYRITLQAHLLHVPEDRKANRVAGKPRLRWLGLSALAKLPFPSAHRKILDALATVASNKCSCNSALDR